MSAPLMNLVGHAYGRLTVIRLAEKKSGRTRWECLCACGNTKVFDAGEIRKGATVSCGCYKSERAAKDNSKDIAGMRFGRLIVVSPVRSANNGVQWRCECVCGGINECYAADLLGGRVISCGCAVFDKPGLSPQSLCKRRSAVSHVRRARSRSADGSFTSRQIDALYVLQRGRCACCHIELNNKYHKDHRIALANGGSNYISNIELLCARCNLKKNSKDDIAWANENGRLI